MRKLIPFLGFALTISCGRSGEEQQLENLNKKSAREVTLTTVTKGDTVYHLTKQSIWMNGEKITSQTDTLVTTLNPKTWASDSTSVKLNQIPIYVTVQ